MSIHLEKDQGETVGDRRIAMILIATATTAKHQKRRRPNLHPYLSRNRQMRRLGHATVHSACVQCAGDCHSRTLPGIRRLASSRVSLRILTLTFSHAATS
jgi:hypothetical protein